MVAGIEVTFDLSSAKSDSCGRQILQLNKQCIHELKKREGVSPG